jgi:shikimate dehydrogenase
MSAEPIHTLADLENWSFPGTALTVVGRPVAHSLSPVIHNAALAAMAKSQPEFSSWRYFKFDIAPEELPRALALFHAKKFRGLNLTVPHKAIAVDHLVSSDGFVKAAGAANTLSYTEEGWSGANTDNYGLSAALLQDLSLELKGADVILLGAGGAARAAAIECLRQHCTSLWIGNRTQPTVHELVENLLPLAAESTVHAFDLANPPATLPAGTIVINATSVGLKPEDPSPLNVEKIPRPRAAYDMIYRPAQTALLKQAATLGIPTANGLSMLVHQGARSLEIWSGTQVPVDVMQAAASAAAHA